MDLNDHAELSASVFPWIISSLKTGAGSYSSLYLWTLRQQAHFKGELGSRRGATAAMTRSLNSRFTLFSLISLVHTLRFPNHFK